jgi:flavorubredoxin
LTGDRDFITHDCIINSLKEEVVETPTFIGTSKVAADTTAFIAYCPLPGLGLLPVNSYLIQSKEPVLVDTNMAAVGEPYLKALGEVIDPADIRWVWLSHIDFDHVGNLDAIARLAPNARFVTPFLGLGKLMLRGFDLSRVHLLEPGATVEVGDRTLKPVRPLYFDAPETMGFVDGKTGTLFAVDSFGAPLDTPLDCASAIPPAMLYERMSTWAALDAPWLGMANSAAMGCAMSALGRLDPATIIGSHLPVARGMTQTLLSNLGRMLVTGRIPPTHTAPVNTLHVLAAAA